MKDREVWDAGIDELASRYPSTAAAHLPLVLIVDNAVEDSWERPRRHRDFMSLYIARQGSGVHVIDDVEYEVVRGDVYAMAPGMSHQFTRPDRLILDTVHFAPSIFNEATVDALASTPGFTSLYIEEPLRRRGRATSAPLSLEGRGVGGEGFATASKWLHLSPSAYEKAASLYAELRCEWAAGSPSGTLLTPGLLLRLLVFLAREYSEDRIAGLTQTGRGPHAGTVAMAVRYIDERFADEVRVDELAASLFLSAGRFTQVFDGVMGCTPREYLKHVRLGHAKTLLESTDLAVGIIASRCGYADAAHFTRQFREYVGQSPRDYRSGR